MEPLLIYSGTVNSQDGRDFSVRYLLTEAEYEGLTEAGILPEDTCMVEGIIPQEQPTIEAYDFHPMAAVIQ
jgi:hypothetical protein